MILLIKRELAALHNLSSSCHVRFLCTSTLSRCAVKQSVIVAFSAHTPLIF